MTAVLEKMPPAQRDAAARMGADDASLKDLIVKSRRMALGAANVSLIKFN